MASNAKREVLTASEIEALSLFAKGMTTRQAAQHLGLSTYAIEERLKSGRKCLGAKNTTHAVALAFRSKQLVL